jgi:NADP-dependent 3-hydroxy acid dehydrogenase YdfG
MDVRGAVALVTGASRGVGRAIALALADAGADVACAARATDVSPLKLPGTIDETVRSIEQRGRRGLPIPTDLSKSDQVEAMVARTISTFGRLDVLVNNAGISKIGPMSDLDVEGWSAMIDVNLRGVLHGIAAALPVFRRQGNGHFVTTVSTAGLKIVPNMGVYAATKNAVRTVLEGLRQESTDGVVRTTAVSPGFVNTDLDSSIDNTSVREEIRRNMDAFGIPPEAVAEAIAFAIDQPPGVEIGEITVRPTVQN